MQHTCEGEKDSLRDHIEISEIITASYKKTTRLQMNFSSKRNNMYMWIVQYVEIEWYYSCFDEIFLLIDFICTYYEPAGTD